MLSAGGLLVSNMMISVTVSPSITANRSICAATCDCTTLSMCVRTSLFVSIHSVLAACLTVAHERAKKLNSTVILFILFVDSIVCLVFARRSATPATVNVTAGKSQTLYRNVFSGYRPITFDELVIHLLSLGI